MRLTCKHCDCEITVVELLVKGHEMAQTTRDCGGLRLVIGHYIHMKGWEAVVEEGEIVVLDGGNIVGRVNGPTDCPLRAEWWAAIEELERDEVPSSWMREILLEQRALDVDDTSWFTPF